MGKLIFEGITMEQFTEIVKEVLENIQIKTTYQKEYLSYNEAAAFLDVKVTTIRDRVTKGMYKKYLQEGSNKPYLKMSEIIDNFV